MYQAIVFFPLLGALIAGLFGRIIGDRPSELISSGLLILSALMSCIAFVDVGLNGEAVAVNVLQWIHSGSLHIDWVLRIDTLTAVMLVVVTCVSYNGAVLHPVWPVYPGPGDCAGYRDADYPSGSG